jgi:predicted Zn-dependent protease
VALGRFSSPVHRVRAKPRGMLTILRAVRTAISLILAAVALLGFAVQPAMAQSILRDAETEQFFNDISLPIIKQTGLSARNVRIVLIGDRSINAFTAGGQDVFMHSGLVVAADNASELQGVIAHELGHVVGGHVLRSSEGIKEATGITILSLLLGAAAIAAGAGDAGAGILAAGQQVALSRFLAFSRTQEAVADSAAQTYLTGAGISGKGMISFFKKLQGLEFRYGASKSDGFANDHPLTGDRIAVLQDKFSVDPAWNKPVDPALQARFLRIKAKLKGFVNDPKQTVIDYPERDQSLPAHYARAYAYHRSAYPEKALSEADALLAAQPHDPYFLELKGQILLESGQPAAALPVLREAVATTEAQPLIAALFGHALIATEDPVNIAEAQRVLKASINRDNDNPFAWYQLGVVFDQQGDAPRAAMASAERYHLEGRPKLALASAEIAVRTLPTGTADWLRAQDIELVSRTAIDSDKRHRRR